MDLYKLFLVLFFLFLVNYTCVSQFVEDFSDGNITADPTWLSSNESGNGSDFQVVNGELQSNGPTATSKIWISNDQLPDVSQEKVVWTFKINYSSAPSSSNNVEIYLLSSNSDLSAPTEGYFIRLGESGSDDGIDFYKTSSTTPLIIDPNPSVATGINVNIRVTRKVNGDWLLEADPTGGISYTTIGSANDSEYASGNYFGFKVEHSSTRNQSFFFDDVAISATDITPPSLVDVDVNSESQLTLTFSEALNKVKAENVNNYLVGNGIGNPQSANVDNLNPNIVHLSFTASFTNGVSQQIQVSDMEDLRGNIASSEFFEFLYFVEVPAEVKDVVINEILANPSPPNDLPEVEYVELFNNSDKIFNLEHWSFSDKTSFGLLNQTYFFPGDILILCQDDQIAKMEPYGHVMGLSNWPTLNNSGDILVIKDNNGNKIDSVNYDDSWYKSSAKASGGWSLELIDPANKCSNKDNWAASEHFDGGTPGEENSVLSEKPDLTPPQIAEVLALKMDSVEVRFSEVMDPQSVSVDNFKIDPKAMIESLYISDNLQDIGLILIDPLQKRVVYNLKVSELKDCSGNVIVDGDSDFNLIEKADSLDLIINEILFNPYSGGVDFVELYNNSSKYINLKGWSLASAEHYTDISSFDQIWAITKDDIILEPDSYLALTEDGIILKEQYPQSKEERFYEVEHLPSYHDDMGTVLLLNPDSALMDLLYYSEEFHFSMLSDTEGVSLERVSFTAPTNDPDNWKSAASTVGFATPGYLNSQVNRTVEVTSGQVIADPKVIIPDGSGHNDFTTINYSFDQAGYVANMRVMDAYGRTVKILGENDYLPAEGFYTWDATNDRGEKVRTGYYLIYLEIFNTDGDITKFKEKIVVGTKF